MEELRLVPIEHLGQIDPGPFQLLEALFFLDQFQDLVRRRALERHLLPHPVELFARSIREDVACPYLLLGVRWHALALGLRHHGLLVRLEPLDDFLEVVVRDLAGEQRLLEDVLALVLCLLAAVTEGRPRTSHSFACTLILILADQSGLRERLLQALQVLVEFHLLRDEGICGLRKCVRLQRRRRFVRPVVAAELAALLRDLVESFLLLFEFYLSALEAEFETEEVLRSTGEDLANALRMNGATQVEVKAFLGGAKLVGFAVIAVSLVYAVAVGPAFHPVITLQDRDLTAHRRSCRIGGLSCQRNRFERWRNAVKFSISAWQIEVARQAPDSSPITTQIGRLALLVLARRIILDLRDRVHPVQSGEQARLRLLLVVL